MVILSDLSVLPSLTGSPSLHSGQFSSYFKKILSICHEQNCKVSAQLFHPEYDISYISRLFHQKVRLSREEIRLELAKSTLSYCDTLTEKELHEITKKFVKAAKLAEEIGFDMIQIHGDRLLGSFTSPHFNHRTDSYQRFHYFAAEVITAIRQVVPKLPLDYKLTVRKQTPEFGKGGISEEQVPEFVQLLENCGIDSFHVTLANHTETQDTIPGREHHYFSSEGCFSDFAKLVKRYTKKPVCCVGKIQHPAYAEKLCKADIDMIGMCRQLIADPDWVNKVISEQEETILYCHYCNKECLSSLISGGRVSCILHSKNRGVL